MGTALKDSTNPHFRSSYADLLSVWRAANPALVANDIAVSQLCEPSDDGALVSVTTILMHKSGQWISGTVTMRPTKADPQGIGSAITYARRYALAASVGVCPEDDDGNAASAPQPTASRAVREVAPRGGEHANGTNGAAKKTPTARDLIVASVKEWTGVKPEDAVAMVNTIKSHLGIKTAQMTPDEQNKVLAWVRGEISKGSKFERVLA